MNRDRLGGAICLASAAAGLLGLRFFFNERSFASRYDNDLASNLQWVGLAIVFLSAAVCALGALLLADRDE